ncbi:hypothetical protein TSAR_005796 [Trichomalopsis sarcophagae]|uniref:Uncharacterized protein n=1 Tax=Trichomalopsis sarcophagae TaxID=543379 RepID=A0A232ED94_9HYME|nr:hypothetical protein TSAR_005796 [Trichomalopsis sarcophagae]
MGNRVVEFTEDFESRLKYYVRVDKAILINGTSYELSEEEQQLGYSETKTGHTDVCQLEDLKGQCILMAV